MSMKRLPPDTVKLISSTQVITSASSVVKELMENAIDAQATLIDIRLENYGLDKIEIRDNGVGISHSDVEVMCLRSYTSKISDLSDLGKLTCYGFRGEALSSICAVANVTVITKSEFDQYAKSFTMDSNGYVIKSSISHHQKGTIIQIVDLFKKFPVRKHLYNSKKHCTIDLRRIENIVKSLAVIQQNVRVSLVHNKSVLWQITSCNNLKMAYGQIWSSSMIKYVKQLTFSCEEVNIDMVIPMQDIDVQNCFFTTNIADAIYVYVNKRPIRDNKIEKLIVREFNNYFGHYLSPGKYLPCIISLTIPAETIDVNLEPDKSRILFHNQETILLSLKNCISKYYYNDKLEDDSNVIGATPSNKRKIDYDSKEVQVKKPVILITQDNDTFTPNAESTQIIENKFLNFECNNDHETIVKNLSLDEIDFEEPFTSNENKSNKTVCSENNEVEKSDDITEYRKKLMNIGKNIQYDNTNVRNFDAENISISQWSKGNVVLNEKPLEGGVSIKSEISHGVLEKNTLLEIKKSEKEITEPQKDEVVNIKNNVPVNFMEDKITNSITETLSLNSNSIKLAPLFRTVSIPDEQIPNLNHLVNRPQSWVPEPRSKVPKRVIPVEDLNDTARSVSSQMGNKEMSGFTLFAKEMRILILQKNPGMDFTKVSKELARLWCNLSIAEKENYKIMANEKKKVLMTTKTNIQPLKKSFDFIFKNLKRHSTLVNIDLSEIKRNIFEQKKMLPLDFTLIGEVENNWICCIRNEVQVINISCLQEGVIFFQKLANAAIPLKMLDQPIKISKNYLGEKNYRFLIDLDTSYEPSADICTITDDRIVKNGFNIVIAFNDKLNNPDVNITDAALHISTYGIEELKQLLELMQMEHGNDLHCCRPLKVVYYLKSETVRICKANGLPKSKEEINNLLVFWFKNEEAFSHNMHIQYKDVFKLLHTIND